MPQSTALYSSSQIATHFAETYGITVDHSSVWRACMRIEAHLVAGGRRLYAKHQFDSILQFMPRVKSRIERAQQAATPVTK